MFVSHKNIEHFNSNSEKITIPVGKLPEKSKKICLKFLIFLIFRTLEGTVVASHYVMELAIFILPKRTTLNENKNQSTFQFCTAYSADDVS